MLACSWLSIVLCNVNKLILTQGSTLQLVLSHNCSSLDILDHHRHGMCCLGLWHAPKSVPHVYCTSFTECCHVLGQFVHSGRLSAKFHVSMQFTVTSVPSAYQNLSPLGSTQQSGSPVDCRSKIICSTSRSVWADLGHVPRKDPNLCQQNEFDQCNYACQHRRHSWRATSYKHI